MDSSRLLQNLRHGRKSTWIYGTDAELQGVMSLLRETISPSATRTLDGQEDPDALRAWIDLQAVSSSAVILSVANDSADAVNALLYELAKKRINLKGHDVSSLPADFQVFVLAHDDSSKMKASGYFPQLVPANRFYTSKERQV